MCVLYGRSNCRYNTDEKEVDTTDFKDTSYDVFRMFSDRWALVTAGGIDYDKLSKDEFISLINMLKKSSLLKGQPNKRGKNKLKKK